MLSENKEIVSTWSLFCRRFVAEIFSKFLQRLIQFVLCYEVATIMAHLEGATKKNFHFAVNVE